MTIADALHELRRRDPLLFRSGVFMAIALAGSVLAFPFDDRQIPGLPLVNWSTRSGDLRVAPFFGMHALQALPLFGFLLDRSVNSPAGSRARLVSAAALVWLVVMGGLLALALRGQPLLAL
jgi:hypothetical protein